MAEKRKTFTSNEVKKRYNDKTFQQYAIKLRKVEDADLIAFIEKNKEEYGTTELFRIALRKLLRDGL